MLISTLSSHFKFHCDVLCFLLINLTAFTVNSSVEHVLMHVTCELDCDSIEDFALKVHGLAEYLELNSCLADYEYIHNCIKLEKDVQLSLLRKDSIVRNLLRTVSCLSYIKIYLTDC